MSDLDARGVHWRPDCRCWCQVRPIVCTLTGCGCIVHDGHGEAEHLTLDELLAAVKVVNDWLDGGMSPEYADQPLAHTWARVTKVCEEAGEVWRALSKLTGENPRKGVCGTREELLGELGDTAAGAIFAIQHITEDRAATWAVVSAAVAKAHSRAVAAGVPAGGPQQ